MQDKTENLFGKLQGMLDDAEFFKWQESDVTTFLSLINEYYHHRRLTGSEEENTSGTNEHSKSNPFVAMSAIDRSLTKLRRFLQERVPYGSLSEPSAPPSVSIQTEVSPTMNSRTHSPPTAEGTLVAPPVYPVDAFLYLEEDVEDLVQRGCISREFCRACGATDIGLTDFITHSFSQDQLLYLCAWLLPALCDPSFAVRDHCLCQLDASKDAIGEPPFSCKHVVDVGSRLGVVPLTCYFASEQGILSTMERVTGIEIDESFVALQRETAKRFASHPASSLELDVVHSDCFAENGACVLQMANVIILHNVFQYFVASPKDHLQAWKRLRELVCRRGQLLICSPPLESTFASFTNTDILDVFGVEKSKTAELNGANKNSRKRCRESCESDCPQVLSTLQSWLDEWVEEVNVSEVREKFMKLRGCSGHEDTCGNNGCEDECGSECSETAELQEGLESIRVYAVK